MRLALSLTFSLCLQERGKMHKKAIIVGVNLGQIDTEVLSEEIEELILLADTAEAKVLDTIIQNKIVDILLHQDHRACSRKRHLH